MQYPNGTRTTPCTFLYLAVRRWAYLASDVKTKAIYSNDLKYLKLWTEVQP